MGALLFMGTNKLKNNKRDVNQTKYTCFLCLIRSMIVHIASNAEINI